MSTPLQWKILRILLHGFRPKITLISIIYFILLFLYTFTVSGQSNVPVFPDADGYGRYTKGGRGGSIIKVTNLNSSGPGSFRDALLASGPRTVVFEVSGTINIGGSITVREAYLTIAGQTAPSPGILIRGGAITFKTHDVLIQHISVRAGNTGDDCIKMSTAGAASDVYNVYIDHVSMSWAKDEVLSIFQRDALVYDISVSHCFITEGLAKNNSYTGAKGFLVGKDPNNSVSEEIGDFSVSRTLFAHNNQRNPYMKNGSKGILVNNVIYGYRHSAIDIGSDDGSFKVATVNNVFKTRVTPLRPPVGLRTPYNGDLYVSGNMLDDAMPAQTELISTSFALMSSSPMNMSVVTVLPTEQTMDYVLANAGARPADRDPVDIRIVNEVQNRTGDWMDQTEVDGYYPNLAVNNKTFAINNPGGDDDGDGYTNLEEKLYQLKLEVEGKSVGEDPDNAPTISAIADQSTPQDTPTNPINFTIGDDKTSATALTVSGASSDQTLVNNSDITLSGNGANRSVTIKPASGKFGSVDITLTVSDGSNNASETFALVIEEADQVPPVNTAPGIASISDQQIDQDNQFGPMTFTISDQETSASQLTVSATSGNQNVAQNNKITLSGSGSQRSIIITPEADQYGETNISITVSDGELNKVEQFKLTVNEKVDPEPGNTAPTITQINDQTTDQDVSVGPISFTVDDAESDASELSVTASSSDQNVISDQNLLLSASGGIYIITIMPNTGAYGSSIIALTVSDGEYETTTSFSVQVYEKDTGGDPDNAPTISSIPNQFGASNTTIGPIAFTIDDDYTSANDLTLAGYSSNNGFVSSGEMTFGGSGNNRTLTITPKYNKSGRAQIEVVVSDGTNTASQSFYLTVKRKSGTSSKQTGTTASNFPNPFSNTTTISYTLEEESNVSLKVYDMRGHHIKSLVHERESAGDHSVEWDRKTDRGELVQDGMYIYKLRVSDQVIMNRMIIGH